MVRRLARPAPGPTPITTALGRVWSTRRGRWALTLLAALVVLAVAAPLWVGSTALYVRWHGESRFPLFARRFVSAGEFDPGALGPPDYRELEARSRGRSDLVILPLYPYGPEETLLATLPGRPPHPPDRRHWMGTDDRGRDVFARLVHGLGISFAFAIVAALAAHALGIAVGVTLGFAGGVVDLLGFRLVEVWSSLPHLYVVMVVAALGRPSLPALALVVASFVWMPVAQYVRAGVLRERARDYVTAAVAIGAPTWRVAFRHVLPNALTPVLTLAPFSVLSCITILISLDFLGFGLPPPTPSLGELLTQGFSNLRCWWLALAPVTVLAGVLFLITQVGEALREACDPGGPR